MTAIIAIVMVLLAFGYTLYPLMRRVLNPESAEAEIPVSEDTSDPLQEKKDSIFFSIQELESDYELGSLSKEDYQQLRQSYEIKALQTLRDIDQAATEKEQVYSDRIEEAVRRQRKPRPVQVPEKAGKNCASCGAPLPGEARFCTHCGETVSGNCAQCGAEILPESRFCSSCGASVNPQQQ